MESSNPNAIDMDELRDMILSGPYDVEFTRHIAVKCHLELDHPAKPPLSIEPA